MEDFEKLQNDLKNFLFHCELDNVVTSSKLNKGLLHVTFVPHCTVQYPEKGLFMLRSSYLPTENGSLMPIGDFISRRDIGAV